MPWENCGASCCASSTTWFSTVSPPRTRLSVPQSPEAELPSPYEIFHERSSSFLNVEDLEASKMLWLDWRELLSSVEKTYRPC